MPTQKTFTNSFSAHIKYRSAITIFLVLADYNCTGSQSNTVFHQDPHKPHCLKNFIILHNANLRIKNTFIIQSDGRIHGGFPISQAKALWVIPFNPNYEASPFIVSIESRSIVYEWILGRQDNAIGQVTPPEIGIIERYAPNNSIHVELREFHEDSDGINDHPITLWRQRTINGHFSYNPKFIQETQKLSWRQAFLNFFTSHVFP